MGTIVLELKAICKYFPQHRAVDDVSFSIGHGEFFSLLGPSGCGKTTTLRMIAGFEQPTSGEILLKQTRIDHLPPYRRSVNTVFQNYALFPHLTVRRNIEFGLHQKKAADTNAANDVQARVRRVIEQVRLQGKEERKPAELSGGERQRVALARSLVLTPDVLLLDEPLSALDPQLRKQVRAELKDLQRSTGVAFLFVTHDQEEAMSLSDRMAVMNKGRVEQIGSPEDIYCRPRTRFTASFLGAINWVKGVGVRPEAVSFSNEGRPGKVVAVTFLGPVKHVDVALEGGETVVVQTSVDDPVRVGDGVQVSWKPEDELRFAEDSHA